ncbi:MAG: 50S ribosomal protein L18 [Dehalococcoidales bacterium]|jgi:large subunit ribosomal protein L18|nr:50S ribosomal protein L18 [Dehalococcoidales bacterium]
MARITPQEARVRRHRRVRAKVRGTSDRPRLAVFRSLNHIYIQVVDDTQSHTLVSASTLDPDIKGSIDSQKKTEQAKLVGSLVAKRALSQGIKQVVFDRGGYKYHGRVKALAEAAREAGLKF